MRRGGKSGQHIKHDPLVLGYKIMTVNIASIMGLSGGGLYPNISYQASKGAVVNMTRALALEWAKDRIRVNAIANLCSDRLHQSACR